MDRGPSIRKFAQGETDAEEVTEYVQASDGPSEFRDELGDLGMGELCNVAQTMTAALRERKRTWEENGSEEIPDELAGVVWATDQVAGEWWDREHGIEREADIERGAESDDTSEEGQQTVEQTLDGDPQGPNGGYDYSDAPEPIRNARKVVDEFYEQPEAYLATLDFERRHILSGVTEEKSRSTDQYRID